MSSARSISSASVMNQIGGMQLMGSGQTRMSSGQTSMSSGLFGAHSVQGGAGGFGTRISQSVFSSGSMGSYGETSVISNGKVTMQNLNDRLASYLQKVHTLESANRKLELQIREYLDKRMPTVSKDFTVFFANISDLRVQNQSISLQADNARLAAEDFKMKYEAELNMRNLVEADVARLRGVRDSFTLSISDLEVHVENLKGELVYFKSNHEEEMRQLRIQQSGTVNVEVDSAASVDLTKVLEEVRLQYEALVLKNNLELEKWFKAKVRQENNMEIIEREIYTCTTEVKTFSTELSELRRTYQSLEISRQSILKEQNLQEVKSRFSIQLSQLQMSINMLETELQQLRVSLEQQQAEYNVLLDIKMRLEMEIAEYRRLLEGEVHERKQAVIISKVEVVEGNISTFTQALLAVDSVLNYNGISRGT
uniref:Keratin 99 n=1 Tax=Labrus bergylta TaxID=56723 RepID=A0A3Q3LTV2_9LABR